MGLKLESLKRQGKVLRTENIHLYVSTEKKITVKHSTNFATIKKEYFWKNL